MISEDFFYIEDLSVLDTIFSYPKEIRYGEKLEDGKIKKFLGIVYYNGEKYSFEFNDKNVWILLEKYPEFSKLLTQIEMREIINGKRYTCNNIHG